jgi:MYXO-CTERM domain-containing protein
VALVDAFGYPNAESDLATYRSNYGLPACTTANGCFTIVNQEGQTSPLPAAPTASDDWTVETALDMEMASSGCPNCKILLVESNNDQDDGLFLAQQSALALGATVISNSWGETEQSLAADGGQPASFYEQYFNHPGVGAFIAAGDQGYDDNNQGPDYPSTSAYVTAVGGTSLATSTTAARGWTEKAWGTLISALGAGGSSCSLSIPKPSWQGNTHCSFKASSDVAAVGDPSTGLAVFNNGPSNTGWTIVGGTSAASPLVASIYALTGHGAASPQLAYQNTSAFNDVTTGTNGACFNILCNAGVGWDGPTGNGTPNGRVLAGVACVPACTGRQCGPDGCGGSCGTCPATDTCSAAGECVCTPQCAGKTCGPDGCGGSCGGPCPTPTVTITSPAAGTVSGNVLIAFSTTNTTASSALEVQLDGAVLAHGAGTTFSQSWSSGSAANGPHTLLASATEGGQTGTATVSINVENGGGMAVSITSPSSGQTVSGSLAISVAATPTNGANLIEVDVFVDSTLAGSVAASPGTVTVDTTRLPDGSHSLTAVAHDSSGASGTSPAVSITIQNGSSAGPGGANPDGGVGTTLNGDGCGCGASPGSERWLVTLVCLLALTFRRKRRSARAVD